MNKIVIISTSVKQNIVYSLKHDKTMNYITISQFPMFCIHTYETEITLSQYRNVCLMVHIGILYIKYMTKPTIGDMNVTTISDKTKR